MRIKALVQKGIICAVSKDSDLYVVFRRSNAPGKKQVDVYNSQGAQLGLFYDPKRDLRPFEAVSMYRQYKIARLGSEVAVYELVLDKTGVYVIKWS